MAGSPAKPTGTNCAIENVTRSLSSDPVRSAGGAAGSRISPRGSPARRCGSSSRAARVRAGILFARVPTGRASAGSLLATRGRISIPQALTVHSLYPLYTTYFRRLGLEVFSCSSMDTAV